MSLRETVQDMRKETVQKNIDQEAGNAQRQLKTDLAGSKYSNLVMIARRVAEELAQRGPITVDDVTTEMFLRHQHDVMGGKGKEQRWKGKIFGDKTKWMAVNQTPATQKTSHARRITMWALRSWLQTNSMNGMKSNISAFVLDRIYSDFAKSHNGSLRIESCTWEIGERCLSPEVKRNIDDAHGKLYGVPVKIIPNAVGAVIRG